MSARKAPDPATRLDTIFLTGPGGVVYEFPREIAHKYALSSERLAQIGHLPIIPYGTKTEESAAEESDDAEVGGRHMTYSPTYGQVWHSNYMYGVYLYTDGNYYQGEHFHPYNTELGSV